SRGDHLAFSFDGKIVAVGSDGVPRHVMAWNVQTGERLLWGGDNLETIKQLAFSPDGLLLAGQNPDVKIWSWKVPGGGGGDRRERAEGYGRLGERLALSPDRRFFAIWSRNFIVVRDAKGDLLWQHGGWLREGERCQFLGVTADSKTVVMVHTITGDGRRHRHTVRRVDMAESTILSTVDLAGPSHRANYALSPDGRTLAVVEVHEECRARLFDTTTGKPRDTEPGHSIGVQALAFSADGKMLASADGGKVKRWNLATGRVAQQWDGPQDGKVRLAFSQDSRVLAVTGKSRAQIRSLAEGWIKDVSLNHTEAVYDAVFSPDGKVLATAGDDKTVRLTRWADGKELRILGHEAEVRSLA